MRKSRDKEGRREEPKKIALDKATNDYNTGRSLDEQKTRKLRESPAEPSDRRR